MRLVVTIIILLCSLSALTYSFSEYENEKLNETIALYTGMSKAYKDKSLVDIDSRNPGVVPIIREGRVLVPLRFLAENLGAKVEWNNMDSSIEINTNMESAKLYVGSSKMIIGEGEIELGAPVQKIYDRTYVPIRKFVEDVFHKKIFYERGLIIISNSDKVFDKIGDKELIDKIISIILGKKKDETELYDIDVKGKKGFIDKKGNIVIQPQFDEAGYFYEGLSCVAIDEKYGFIDEKGNYFIDPMFDHPSIFEEGYAFLHNKFIKRSTKEIMTPPYDYTGISRLQEGKAVILKNRQFGYMDQNGKVAIEPKFEEARDFSEGFAAVSIETTGMPLWGYIDGSGKFLIEPRFMWAGPFSEGIAHVTVMGSGSGYIDKTGRFIIEPKLYGGEDFCEGFASVWIDRQLYYIDKSGAFVLGPFDDAESFAEGLAAVHMQGKWGYIDKKGEIVIEPQFSRADYFRNDLAYVETEDWKGYIDKSGNIIWKLNFEPGEGPIFKQE